MNFDWQTWIALSIVAMSAAWMLRRLLATGNGDSGCGSCSSCSSETNSVDKTQPKRVYQLTQSDR